MQEELVKKLEYSYLKKHSIDLHMCQRQTVMFFFRGCLLILAQPKKYVTFMEACYKQFKVKANYQTGTPMLFRRANLRLRTTGNNKVSFLARVRTDQRMTSR